MKRFVKYFAICLLVIFSFYYTNLVSSLFINKSNLMKQINDYKDNHEESFVNAQINNNYIIPGINGLTIDTLESYHAMKINNSFDEELIVLKEIPPENSYYEHKDLVINKGNPLKNSVSIIINNNKEILEYSINQKIVFNRLVDLRNIKSNVSYQQINHDFLHYEEVEKILDKDNMNTNICIINNGNIINFCDSYGKYLVKPSYVITNQSINNKTIKPGDIIYIDNNLSLSKFKILLKRISYENLKLSYLDYLISENR